MKSTFNILKLTSEFGKNDSSGSCAIQKQTLNKNSEWVRWNRVIIGYMPHRFLKLLTEKVRTILCFEPANPRNLKGVTKYGKKENIT